MKRQLDAESAKADEFSTSEGEEDVVAGGSGTIKSSCAARLGQCEVCAAQEARYACPKCEVKTCSLQCVQIHKKELNCDGIRDRTKFIPLRKMTKMDFMSDYYFLEECTRYVEDRKHDRVKNYTRYNKVLSTYLFRLRNAAAQRKTTLRFLLQNFARRRENTTYFDWKLHKIFWRVEWIFVNACSAKYVDERCSEDEPLHVLLDKYLNANNTEEVPQKKNLKFYQGVGSFGLKILLKAEGIKRSGSRFHALDASKTLKENLVGKTLVEFPCIYLSYETNPDGFDVIDSDEDVELETKAYQASLEEMRRKQLDIEAGTIINHSSDENEDDSEKLKKLLEEKRQEERRRKREDFEKLPSNYLFADEKLWDILSSENESGNETEEESPTNTTVAKSST